MSTPNHPIKLIIGLGNPGAEYEKTRHNAGAWFVEKLATQNNLNLKYESKFLGKIAKFSHEDQTCLLFLPTTFMNHSGQAARAVCQFYKIAPENMLVAHDELDLPTGNIKLKFDGGHGGHNGLSDIISHLQTKQFYRLRIGIGHPGNKNDVVNYVLSCPSKADEKALFQSIDESLIVISDLFSGKIQHAMQKLHIKKNLSN
jgi:PTH1 family peptidyl-tRNA hydrolase